MRTRTKIALIFTLPVTLLYLLVIWWIFFVWTSQELAYIDQNLRENIENTPLDVLIEESEHLLVQEADGDFLCEKGLFADRWSDLIHNKYVTIESETYYISRHTDEEGMEICMAERVSEFQKMINRFARWLLSMFIPVIAITYLMGLWIAHMILQPIRTINTISSSFSTWDDKKIPLPKYCKTGDEICHLTWTLNGLFDRVNEDQEKLNRFSADVSHEFRNALWEIDTEIQLTRKVGNHEEAFEKINDRLGSLNQLIDDLLKLARYEWEELLWGTHDIGRVIDSVPETKKCVFVEPKSPVMKVSHPWLLRIAVGNIIWNALKFSPTPLSVTITLTSESLIIEDAWPWVDDSDIGHIFERFYKAEKNRSYKSWHGLGLSMSKEIVEWVHGWWLRAENREEGWLRVSVYF